MGHDSRQSSTSGPNLTHAQAAAAINAHMTDNDERERLQQSLEEITQASFGEYFWHLHQPPLMPRLILPHTLPSLSTTVRSRP